MKNLVLKLDQKTNKYSVVFNTKEYHSLRNITSDETGNFLYLNDIERGIVVINLKTQKIYNLASSGSLNLMNISDLIYDDHGLIIIQNGFSPERVLRLNLKGDNINIGNILPIESNHPTFNSPSYGVVVDEGLYFIANSQLPKTNRLGGLLKNQQWENLVIISSPKHHQEKATLEYQKAIEKYKKKSGIKQ
jgi:hypothetical protein